MRLAMLPFYTLSLFFLPSFFPRLAGVFALSECIISYLLKSFDRLLAASLPYDSLAACAGRRGACGILIIGTIFPRLAGVGCQIFLILIILYQIFLICQ
jgi:hypothetical protein